MAGLHQVEGLQLGQTQGEYWSHLHSPSSASQIVRHYSNASARPRARQGFHQSNIQDWC